jgi:hypothetical protein
MDVFPDGRRTVRQIPGRKLNFPGALGTIRGGIHSFLGTRQYKRPCIMMEICLGAILERCASSFGRRLVNTMGHWVEVQSLIQQDRERHAHDRFIQKNRQDYQEKMLRLRQELDDEAKFLSYNRDRNLEALKSELRQAVETHLLMQQYELDHSPTNAPPGKWLESTFGTPPSVPLVLFNTHLRHDGRPEFNPLEHINESFRMSIGHFSSVTIKSFGIRPFAADDGIDQFYNREIAPLPCMIVTGLYDGNAISVQASVYGMLPGQIAYSEGQRRVLGETFHLGRFPLTLRAGIEDVLKQRESHNQRIAVALANELYQWLHSLVISTSLQAILDCYNARWLPDPRGFAAHETFEKQLSFWEASGLTVGDLDPIRQLLESQQSLCQKTREITGLLRVEPLPSPDEASLPKDGDEEMRFPWHDKQGPTLF